MPDLSDKQILLTYGLNNEGGLVHISKVKNGLGCNCSCPNCKSVLIAKNNPLNKKKAHFAHHSGKECDGAFESALHLLAKAVIQETKKIYIPNYHYDYNPNNDESIYKRGKSIIFDEVILEESFQHGNERIIVDAVGYINGKKVLIEFANTHFVDNRKWEKIVTMGFPCIEIDLINQQLDTDGLFEFFNSDTDLKYWILNPRYDNEYNIKTAAQRAQLEARQRKENEIKLKIGRDKYDSYNEDPQYKLIKMYKGSVSTNCPKYLYLLSSFKSSRYYFNRHLKNIIDGVFWNEEIYGYPPNGCYIYLNKERIMVLPPDEEKVKYSHLELEEMNLFYSGLKRIQYEISDPTLKDCLNCKYSIDRFNHEDKYLQVCKYPNE